MRILKRKKSTLLGFALIFVVAAINHLFINEIIVVDNLIPLIVINVFLLMVVFYLLDFSKEARGNRTKFKQNVNELKSPYKVVIIAGIFGAVIGGKILYFYLQSLFQ